ncbi:dedicator of cytokinesis protein 3-like isoform X2 [Dreissena polymorpha]|uniref:dedicator of cytokinesis protein 3-like isoform X2 n=1 Tax=Dreissena polymorpha TaxID=45954 RepID=UPI002263E03E|nr:dedicator of cytokinesis protein 3-like isoform X2 [Dreissena polymorpha]
MPMSSWTPSSDKFGVAVGNYAGDQSKSLAIQVGDTVHILEKYGSGPTAWYRGTTMKNKEKVGIFPASIIHIKKCTVENNGLYETVKPVEDHMAREVSYVLWEWSHMWKQLATGEKSVLLAKVRQNVEELINLRSQLINDTLSSTDARDIRRDIVSIIDWGNAKLGIDLVPRIDGEQVDVDCCSVCNLYRIHMNSAEIAQDDKPKRHTTKRQKSSKGEVIAELGIITHHLLISFKNFGCNVGDPSETMLSLYQVKDGHLSCITEQFMVCYTKEGGPEDQSKLGDYYGLFTDLTSDELEKELYLVAQIYRKGSMKPENQKKNNRATFKRPWGVGVVNFTIASLSSAVKMWTFTIKIQNVTDKTEPHFAGLHEEHINRLTQENKDKSLESLPAQQTGKLGLVLTVSVQVFHGDLTTVKKENPVMFSKGVALIQKIGFADIISPVTFASPGHIGEIRNDFYVTLKKAALERGNKTSGKNVEVKVTVYNESGQEVKGCIVYGCGEKALNSYQSSVYYHSNHAEWDETIRLSVPIDTFPGCHVCFELFHCSVSQKKDSGRKMFGFAFFRVTNKSNIVIRDGLHELCVYKVSDNHHPKQFFRLPFLLDDFNDPQQINNIPKHMFSKANERESLTIATLLCSGKFTQNGDLPCILNWRGEEFKGKLDQSLDTLCKMKEDEIVKFLHDILNSLFDMMTDRVAIETCAPKIFKTLVHIFTLIHHVRYEMFKPVLESYITDTFSATLVHKPLCSCFQRMVDDAYVHHEKQNLQLIQSFQVIDFIFRFIVQSRLLQQKDLFNQRASDAQEFQDNLQGLFRSIGTMLSSTDRKLQSNQSCILTYLHAVYTPLLEVLKEREVSQLVNEALQRMPPVTSLPDDITKVKLELLRRTVSTRLFKCDVSRHVLLDLCMKEVKSCLEQKHQTKLAIELYMDIMDQIFQLQKTSETHRLIDFGTDSVRENIKNIMETLFDATLEQIIELSTNPASVPRRKVLPRVKIRKSHTHSAYTMKHETKFSRLKLPRASEDVAFPNSRLKLPRASEDVVFSKAFKTFLETEPGDNGSESGCEETVSTRHLESQHCGLIACLLENLRLMEDEHFSALMFVNHRGPKLHGFLMKVLLVFKVLVDPHIFPQDWSTMRMVSNHIMFLSMEHFADAIQKHFTKDFSVEIWNMYFNLVVAFITQPSLQLDRYSEVKAEKFRNRYQDMRVLMGVQVETLWQSLGVLRRNFMPALMGPFLQLTLVPAVEVRKATLPIIFDMMACEQKVHGHFNIVASSLIERLDFLLTQEHMGDDQYMELFHKMLMERVRSEPDLKETGEHFVTSVTHLLEKLLDYRQVVDGDENKDKRMHCTFNILNFYKDELNREEMYIRYVNKLHELHMVANNYAEAGLTLQLYAKSLGWSDKLLPAGLSYTEQKERDRKEMLYRQIINSFDKGKVWEYALPLCKDLAEYYEQNFEYKKLGDLLKQKASFYMKIMEAVPGENPDNPEDFYPRQEPAYYRVTYYGKSFPLFVRNKQFIYRGDECLKLATIINHLSAEFPLAQIIRNNNPENEALKDGEQQFIQICSVKPIPQDRPEFYGKDIPLEIRNFYMCNEVDTFQFDRPYHQGVKDPDNEIKTLCIERMKMKTAYKFPGILRWFEVIDMEVEMLSPIRVALEQLKQRNGELQVLIDRCLANPKLYFTQLEMRLNGTIQAVVQGGVSKFHEAFLNTEFESQHPEDAIYITQLKELLTEQISVLGRGMQMHKKFVPPDLMPLHQNLEQAFKKMRSQLQDLGELHLSQVSLCSQVSQTSLTSQVLDSELGQSSSSGSFSAVSFEVKPKVDIPPQDVLFNFAPTDRTRWSYVPFPEEGTWSGPPPVPSRPSSLQLHGNASQPGNETMSLLKASKMSVSTGNLPRHSTVVKHFSERKAVPSIPPKRRPSAPTIPSTPNAGLLTPTLNTSQTAPVLDSSPNAETPDLPPRKPRLSHDTKEFSTHLNGDTGSRPVPPLPPRQHHLSESNVNPLRQTSPVATTAVRQVSPVSSPAPPPTHQRHTHLSEGGTPLRQTSPVTSTPPPLPTHLRPTVQMRSNVANGNLDSKEMSDTSSSTSDGPTRPANPPPVPRRSSGIPSIPSSPKPKAQPFSYNSGSDVTKL